MRSSLTISLALNLFVFRCGTPFHYVLVSLFHDDNNDDDEVVWQETKSLTSHKAATLNTSVLFYFI